MLLCFILLAAAAQAQPADPALISDAARALSFAPVSVVDKQTVPPSGDKHDYMSQAPYWWPDPSKPDGLPYVHRDGERNPEISRISDRDNLGRVIGHTATLGRAYEATRDERYAAHAARLVRTWFLDPATRMNPHLEFGQGIPGITQGRGIGIIETRDLPRLIEGVHRLAGSRGWTSADEAALKTWMGAYLKWLVESPHGQAEAKNGNNHETWYDVQVAGLAFFTGHRDLARRTLDGVRERIAKQIEPDGRQPRELARTRSWDYSIMNLAGFFELAAMGEKAGVDLWNYRTSDGRSIRGALDFLLPYATAGRRWELRQITTFRESALQPLMRRARAVWKDDKYAPIVVVSDVPALAAAILAARPGDVIIMKNGTWRDVDVNLTAAGSETAPVTLRAETAGSVILTGSATLTFAAPHIVVEGLHFNGGALTGGAVVRFASHHGRLAESAIADYNPPAGGPDYHWVIFEGSDNRIERAYFKGKTNHRPMVTNRPGARRNAITSSHFKDFTFKDVNGGETVQIMGYGMSEELGDDGAFFTLERNLFEETHGEGMEIISIKSNRNVIRDNTFRKTKGGITNRSGNYNVIEGNILVGEKEPRSYGIRVTGQHHRVAGNYVADVDGSCLLLVAGEYIDKPLTPEYQPILREGTPLGRVPRYAHVKHGVYENNTFVNCGDEPIVIGSSLKAGWPQAQRILMPEKNRMTNNPVLREAPPNAPRPLMPADVGPGWLHRTQRSRTEWGAVPVTVTQTDRDVVITGRKRAVTLSKKDLSISIRDGQTTWRTIPSSARDMTVRRRGEDVTLRLADARKIVFGSYDASFKTGVRIELSGWRHRDEELDVALFLTVALEGRDEDLTFGIAAREGAAVVRQLDWPTAMDAADVDHTVMSHYRGILLPRTWPQAWHPIRAGAAWPDEKTEVQSNVIESWSMSWWGFQKGPSAIMVIVETPDDAAYQFEHPAGGPTVIGPRWRMSLGALRYPRGARMAFFEKGNYVDLAKRYRRHAIETGLFVSLKQKIAATPQVASLIGTPLTRFSILRNLSPDSSRYDKTSPDKNYALTTFDQAAERLKELKQRGFDRFHICLTGWPRIGYDREHPDVLPPAEVAGGWDGMKRLTDAVRTLGYVFTLHDQYRDYYSEAPSYDPQFAIHEEDETSPTQAFPGSRFGQWKEGRIPFMRHWDGGKQTYISPRFMLGHLRKNYELMFDHGIKPDGSYLDVFGYVPPDEDFNPLHPTTRTEAIKERAASYRWARQHLGIVGTEAAVDWTVPYVDISSPLGHGRAGIPVPLFNLVYHDAIMTTYNPTDLRGLLNAGVPQLGLGALSGADGEKTADAMRRMAALHERVALLELTRHEFLDADHKIERSTFADGTTVTVDWNTQTVTVNPEKR